MIVILSSSTDLTTHMVCAWLKHFDEPHLILDEHTQLIPEGITDGDAQYTLHPANISISMAEIGAFVQVN